MKTKLINCLTSLSSPATEDKKKWFRSLMNNGEAAISIANMAVENDNSVEDTKNMLLNYV